MDLHKIAKILALIFSVIGALLLVFIIAKGDTEIESAYDLGGDTGQVDNMSYLAYLVLGIIVIIVLFFVLKGLFAGNIKKTLMSLGLFIVVLALSYVIATGNDLDVIAKGDAEATESTSRYVGTGLYMFYILALGAIASMVIFGVKKLVK